MYPRDQKEEEMRLKNSADLMYGNKDTDKVFPFDKAMRFHWVVFHEVLGVTEDGQTYSKVSTRRYSFFSPAQWDEVFMPKGQKSWFELNKKSVTILHNPLEQAKFEGVSIKGYHADKTGMSLHEKLQLAKAANEVAATEQAEAPKKAGRPKKEEVSNG